MAEPKMGEKAETPEGVLKRSLADTEKTFEFDKSMLQQELMELVNIARTTKVGCLFFTDKSARPLAWAFRDVWHQLRDNGLIGEEEEMPAIRFIDIGRFQNKDRYLDSSPSMEAAKKYQIPEGRTVLIVDDFSESGQTLATAKDVVGRLFPGRGILCHAVSPLNAPWYGRGYRVIGIQDAEEGELWARRVDGERGKQLRGMVKKYLTDAVVEKVKSGLLVLTDALPRPYSDPYIKSRIQRQLDEANKRILLGNDS